jgi:eukaryotic-like serine/threonine-protein kinase
MATESIDSLFLAFQEAVAGRYSLERELGRGGMGVVYLAREVRLDRPVAIKLLPPELAAQSSLRDRFLREARTAARLSHPYIVPIHSVDEIDGFVFYTMAYVDGETLGQRVAERGPLPSHDVTRILREVAWALAYAHAQGVVHRDIKPANILLERGTGRAMVTDFGIARVAQAGSSTAVGEVLGTPEYMSPEQAAGEALDGRSDLYSLGVVGFFALTGTLPFSAPTVQGVLMQHLTKPAPLVTTVARDVPPGLAQAIDVCLRKDAGARHATGEAVADALAPALEKRADIPVAIRVFLDRRRMVPLILPPVMTFGPLMALVARTAGGSNVSQVAGVAGLIAIGVGVPLTIIVMRMRRLLRLGYGPDDVAVALRTSFARRREEFLFEFGPERSRRERFARVGGIAGLALAGAGVVAAVAGFQHSALAGAAFFSGYLGVLGTIISRNWSRMRNGRGSLWTKFWQGKPGHLLGRIASFKLGQRTIAADRPTELAIAMSAEAVYASFPKEVRESLGDVPEAVRGLEAHARVARARIAELDAALLEARNQPGRGTAAERQTSLVRDLTAAREQAEERLAAVVASLENLRLDLLRLRVGAGSAEGITRDLLAAKALGEDADRLLAAAREVKETLAR